MSPGGQVAVLPLTDRYRNPEDPVVAYRDNPLIGALGPVMTDLQIRKRLTRRPTYDPRERDLPAHLRAHAVCAVQQLFVPGLPHQDVVREVGILLRQGYVHRNPITKEYRKQLRHDRVALTDGTLPPERYSHVPLLGTSALGTGGTGKSVAFDIALGGYPQVVEHRYEVDGIRTAFTQVCWLKIDLYQDASLRSFGIEFFEKLGEALGVPIRKDWGADRCNGNLIQPLIYRACQEYNVGLLVLDEVQNMTARGQGYRAVLSYFIRMMNCLGLPIALIGNGTANALLKQDLSAARRFLGRIRPFRPFKPGPMWDIFLHEVWRYQYVKTASTPEEFSERIYELTGGVPDLVIKLFTLTQARLFGRKCERITDAALQETAGHLFATIGDRIAEIKGQAPESMDNQIVRDQVDARFRQVANSECGRVGAAPQFADEPSPAPIEVAEGRESESDPLIEAGKAPDRRAALAKLGVLQLSI